KRKKKDRYAGMGLTNHARGFFGGRPRVAGASAAHAGGRHIAARASDLFAVPPGQHPQLADAGSVGHGAEQALNYLARYTWRVAISNDRLESQVDRQITLGYKAYAHGHRWQITHSKNRFIGTFCNRGRRDHGGRLEHRAGIRVSFLRHGSDSGV